jgi:2',3'-cyclic-nucleotide 2'-phosphodiesterase (5'-nucleotidase family)
MFGLAEWKIARENGLPVVAANVFADKALKKSLFAPYVIKEDHGAKLACVGLVSATAWKARQDTATAAWFKSPYDMQKLMTKAAKKSDHLTVIGEFTPHECDSLAGRYPDVDLIVSSGIKSGDRPREVGTTIIVGSQSRGYYGNYVEYVDLHNRREDSTAARYRASTTTLDPNLPEDSTTAKMLERVQQQINNPEGH